MPRKQYDTPSRGRLDYGSRVKIHGGLKALITNASQPRTSAANPRRSDFDPPPVPVTLPRLRFLEKPMLETTPREILGAKIHPNAPSSTQYLKDLAAMREGQAPKPPDTAAIAGMFCKGSSAGVIPDPNQPIREELDDSEIILEGEVALQRILSAKDCYPDWRAIGLAVLAGRRICMREAGVERPHGIKYSRRFNEWLSKHHFDEITQTTRKCSCLIAENVVQVDGWLNQLPETRRRTLNHPQVIWREFQRQRDDKNQRGWRERKVMS
jgi:hypothetical protein